MYSLDEIKAFCKKYGKKRLVLDTNLLVLFIIGTCDKGKISACNLTSVYGPSDYEVLLEVFRYFNAEVIITPHILTELSNLCRSLPDRYLKYYFSVIVSRLETFKEEHVGFAKLKKVDLEIVTRMGYPDLAIIEAALMNEAAILTNDLELALFATYKGIPCINFANIQLTSLSV